MKLIRRPTKRTRTGSTPQRLSRKMRLFRMRDRSHASQRPQRSEQAWFGDE